MNDDRLLNLRFWIGMILRRRWWIAGCTGGVTLLAALFSFLETPTYEATSRLYLNRQRIQPLPFSDLYQKPQITGRPNDLLMTQMEIILSTPVIEGAVRDLEAQGQIDFTTPEAGTPTGLRALVRRLRGGGGVPDTPETRRAAYVANLQENVVVTPSGGNAFLLITVPGTNASRVARLANAIAESYLSHDRELHRSTSEQAINWLSGKVREQKEKLMAAEDSLREFAGRPTPRVEEMGELVVQEVSRLQQALLDVRLKLLKTETEGYLGAGASTASGLPPGVETQVQDEMRSKVRQDLVEATMRLSELRQKYGEKHPDVVAAAETVQHLKEQMARLGSGAGAPAGTDQALPSGGTATDAGLAALRQQEKSLRADLDRAMRGSADKGQAEVTYAILKREAEINRALYNEMVSRLNEITISSGIDAQVAELFEAARPPAQPIAPVHSRNLLLGLVGGLLLGLAVASVREHLDHSVRDPTHANDLLRAPVLGMVPHQEPHSLTGPGVTSRLAIGSRADSPAAEAYRILRSHIEGVLTQDETRTFLLTSAMPGEGKSTTAANIAAAFAEMRRKVLLIDGDFRRPSLTRYFPLPSGTCLSKALMGTTRPELMVQKTPIKGLDFLGCQAGTELSDSPNLREQFQTLFEWARQRYDHVVVDTPIMMVTPGVTDIARAGAAIVLVHRPGRVPAPVLEQIREHVGLSRLRLVGVVLNAIKGSWLTSNYAMMPYYASYYRSAAPGDAEPADRPDRPARKRAREG